MLMISGTVPETDSLADQILPSILKLTYLACIIDHDIYIYFIYN
jgi:hypothetical protein